MSQPTFDPVAAIRDALAKADVPSTVHLDITYRCDLDCEHCYLDQKDTWPEMTTKDWLTLVEELYTAGVPYLIWSGGEVFARPDFMEMLSYASRRGFISVVKTHAGNVTPAMATALAEHSVSRVDVSVYSLDDEIHDGITRVPGSLRATLAGIRALRGAGLEVSVNTVGMNANIDEFESLRMYFEGLGCEFRGSLNVLPDNSGGDTLDKLALSPEALARGTKTLLNPDHRNSGRRLEFDPTGNPCGAGRTLMYVAPDGAIWPCAVFPASIGNVRERSFLETWHTSPFRLSLRDWTNKDRTACQSCVGNGVCFYCPGEAYKRTGDFKQAPDVFHERARIALEAYAPHAGVEYTPEEWATIPASAPVAPQPKKFAFPIYKPGRGQPSRPGPSGD